MITDSQLYTLALFLGALSMVLIVLYHWLEINAKDSISSARRADSIPATGGKAKLKN
jgi:oligosaccharyl transferase complex subunit OST4